MKEWIITDDFLDELTKKFASAQGSLHELIQCKDCELFYKNRSPFEQHKCDSGNETGYCFWAVRREE